MNKTLLSLILLMAFFSCDSFFSLESSSKSDLDTTIHRNVDPVINLLDTLRCACGTADLVSLATQDTFSAKCRKAMMSFLPPNQDSVANRLLPLGSGIVDSSMVLFYSGASAHAIKLYRYDGATASLVDTARYTFRMLKDFSGPVVSISSIQDYSGSMFDQDIDNGVEIFSDLFSAASLTDRFETDIILFSDSVLLRMDFSGNRDSIASHISRYDGFGRKQTRLFDALGIGFTELARRPSPVRMIIVSTDGGENDSRQYLSKEELYAMSRQQRIPVIVLGSLLADLTFMKEVARETRGAYIYCRTILELKQRAKSIGAMFENAAGIVLDSVTTASPPDSFALESAGNRIVFPAQP
jgi:hypothetical protein